MGLEGFLLVLFLLRPDSEAEPARRAAAGGGVRRPVGIVDRRRAEADQEGKGRASLPAWDPSAAALFLQLHIGGAGAGGRRRRSKESREEPSVLRNSKSTKGKNRLVFQ